MDAVNERLLKIENRLTTIESKFDLGPPSVLPDPPKRPPPFEFKPAPKTHTSSLVTLWLKENWLSSIGIFLIILALCRFISYAFANDWIGETMRVFLGFIIGVIIYSTGFWLISKRPKAGQTLIILGEGVTIIAFFAGHQVYSIFSTFHTFLLMFTVVSVTAIIAIKNNLESLGFSSIIFAGIIPMLLNVQAPNAIFLMSYVLIINAAAQSMWTMRGWGKTLHIAWLTTFVYSFSLANIQEQWIVNFFIWVFYLIFFISVAFPIYKKKIPSLPLKGTFILSTLTLVFMFWIDSFTEFPWNAISYSTASLLSSALGYSMAKNWNQIEPNDNTFRYILGGIIGFSALFLMFMTTHELTHHLFLYPVSSDAKTLLYFIEVAAAISIGYFILQSPALSTYFSLFFIIPLITTHESPLNISYAPFISLKFAILCTAMVSLFIAARINHLALLHSVASPVQRLISNLLWIMTSIFAMIFVWNICHQIFPTGNTARGVAQVVYIIAAEIFICIGNLKELKNFRLGGFAIILFVVSRLLLVEVWQMPIVIRTVTFVVIGLLLVGNAFFENKYKK